MRRSAPMAVARGLALLVSCLVIAGCASKESQTTLSEADIADNNRGVALMGYFDYGGARETFAALVERQPGWLDARVNLAIATLNRQQEGDEGRALELVEGVLAEQPDHLRAHYVSGLLRLYLGEAETAARHFGTVAQADPDDGYAAYYYGQSLVQLGRVGDAVAQYRRAMQLDPYLRSAYYGAALALRRTGRADEASGLLADYQRFENNPRARLAEFKYTRMGPKAEVRAIDRSAAPEPAQPSGPVFAAGETVAELPPPDARSSLTTVDIDADGDQDLYLTRVGAEGAGALLIAADDGFVRAAHPLAQVDAVNAAAWGDFDNDGRVDAYLCREGANQLWRQDDGGWTDVTAATGTGNGSLDCADALMIDADHDGDLDLFVVNRDGPNELLNNNGDGSFRPLAAAQGIGGRPGSTGAAAADLDNDRDLDLIVFKSQPPHEVFLNDRLWQYRPDDSLSFSQASLATAVPGDLDTDGRTELIAVDPSGVVTRRIGDAEPVVLLESEEAPAQIGLDDFDGDGHLDLLLAGHGGWRVYSPAAGRELAADAEPVARALAVYSDAGTGPALVVARRDGRVQRYAAGPGRYPFAAFTLSGKEEQAESMRSNRDGLGARVELRVGSRWTIADRLDRDSAPGQSLQPLMLGVGGAASADFIALTWSDGVYQTELDLAAGELHAIEETQRQLSSCPVLFAWDGDEYRFVTDLLGVGGLGFFVEPGVSATPRPWEYLLLPEGLPVQRDGRLVFKLTEPMEELAYIDSVRLHAYDLPAGIAMTLDERMVIEGPPATGEALFYERLTLPVQAFDQDGRDVTATISRIDRQAAPVGEPDPRFIGRLAQTHALTLDFVSPLDQQPGTPLLIVDGWVEYPYSQTVFAAWQAGASYDAPTLEAYGGDGRWHVVYPSFGYPAGMPRQMTLPLTDLPPGTMRLRLSTNLEVYWDRIGVAHSVPATPVHEILAPVDARQRLIGFPRRTTGPQRLPHYDYSRRDSFWDTRYPRGDYTAFGPVLDLVGRSDDAVAVIGPGEEIEFAFSAPPAAAPGTVRRYVLEVRGWAKDMDLYTRDGGTVGPLPVRDAEATDEARRALLHRTYHTRFQSGR